MKKILFLPLLFLMTASFSDLAAQRSRYQGEIQVGFGARCGKQSLSAPEPCDGGYGERNTRQFPISR